MKKQKNGNAGVIWGSDVQQIQAIGVCFIGKKTDKSHSRTDKWVT